MYVRGQKPLPDPRRPLAKLPEGSLGVHLHRRSAKWRATTRVNGKTRHIGLYDTLEEAQKAREVALQSKDAPQGP